MPRETGSRSWSSNLTQSVDHKVRRSRQMTTQGHYSSENHDRQVCRFCVDNVSISAVDPWDRPLLSTDNFYVVPSLGSLVEGWLLVIPKDHVISAAALDGP